MKVIFSIILGLFFQFVNAQNPNYNQSLADSLGADDYGMKSYFMVMLKTGSNESTDSLFLDSCFRSHMNNIIQLVESGDMIIAGPFGKNEDHYRGIFVFNVPTQEEVEQMLLNDGAIQEGILEATIIPWYASAALPTYLNQADLIWTKKP